MSFLASLLTWANLPFMVAITSTLAFAALQASGLLGLLGGGDADGHADAGHDVSHELSHDVDMDHSHDHGPVLGTTGVNKIPTTIIWQTFAMSFGLIGVIANTSVLIATGVLPTASLLISLPAGAAGGFATTKLVVGLLRRIIPTEAHAPGLRDLVGLSGVVVSEKLDEEFGEIRVKAPNGEFVQVACRTFAGEKTLGHHSDVVIVKYDRELDALYVSAASAESDAPQLRLKA